MTNPTTIQIDLVHLLKPEIFLFIRASLSYPEGKHIIFYRKRVDWIDLLGILHKNMDFRLHL